RASVRVRREPRVVAGDRRKQASRSGRVLGEDGSSSNGEGRNTRERARGDRAFAAGAAHALPSGETSRGPRESGTGAAGGDCGVERRTSGAGSEGAVAIGVVLAESTAIGRDSVRCDPEESGTLSRSLCADAGTLDRAAPVTALLAHRTGGARNQPGRVPTAGGDGERDGEYSPGDGR